MAAMYAPTALEPTRWVPGDGFQLQPEAAPYRLLRRQRFDFLSSRETLIFEGCRALYRPPQAADWAWDGALRIWVQVYFGPPSGLQRRSTAFLCGATPLDPTATDPQAAGALNILPEILDRRSEPDFEVVVLDLRGGRSLPEIRDDGWNSPGVPSPFDPAGAIELLHRLLELNALAANLGLCLAMLHPDQVMVDENLNLRIRGLPWLVPVDAHGKLPDDWAATLATRSDRDLVLAPTDTAQTLDGRLSLRWLAAFVHYLATGRWEQTTRPLGAWLQSLFRPDNRRLPEPWEAALLTRLWTAEEPAFTRLAPALLAATQGCRQQLLRAHARTFCKSINTILNTSLQENNWAEVLRLATDGSAPLPAVFQAAAAAEPAAADPTRTTAESVAEGDLSAAADFLALNAVLDQIAQLQTALDQATGLAEQTAGAPGNSKRPTLVSGRPAHFADLAPLGAPRAQPLLTPVPAAAPTGCTVRINALGVPVGEPSTALPAAAAPRWRSPLQALATALAALPAIPAFQARLLAWLPTVQKFFSAVWLNPPLTAVEQATLNRHAPALLAALPALLSTERQAAAAELQAAAAACATGGARDLPRFDRALRGVLRPELLFPLAPTADSADPAVAAAAQAEASVARVEAAQKIDVALLARVVAAATAALPAAADGSAAPAAPAGPRAGLRIGALCRLEAALQAAQSALAAQTGEQALQALAAIRPALDEWPQYPALQERWQQALAATLLPAVAGLERAVAPAPADATVSAPEPATVVGLVALIRPASATATPCALNAPDATVSADPASPDPWLGSWQPRIAAALTAWFAQHTGCGGPLAQRRQWMAAYGPALARFDPPTAAACAAHLALNAQRRIDLRTALTGNRAQAAWGKAAALWTAGETTLNDDLPADQTPGFAAGEDLGRRALALWLEQAAQAIAQLPAPTDAAVLTQFYERLFGPLRQVADWLASAAATPTASVSCKPVSVSARDLSETVQAIEEELYLHMLEVTERPEQFAVWEAAWAAQQAPPQSPRWQALATAAGQLLWADWLTACAAVADHRLEAAQLILAGQPPDRGVDRFRSVATAAAIARLVDRWATAFDRQQAAAARALARQDLDAAVSATDRDLARSKDITSHAHDMLQNVKRDLLSRQQRRDSARAAADRHRQAMYQAVAAGRLAAALEAFHALESGWPAAEFEPSRWAPVRREFVEALRTALQQQLVQAETELRTQPTGGRATLQAVAAVLEADRDAIWPGDLPAAAANAADPPPAPDDLRPVIEARLTALYGRYLAGRADERYGGALFAGLSTGTLPADAPFWAALLMHHRPAGAGGADNLGRLRSLPVGALGPEEWLAWLTATAELGSAREQAQLPALRARVQARADELTAENARLQATLDHVATAPGLAAPTAALRAFIGRWRIGRQVERRKADLVALETAAQAQLDQALAAPGGAWLTRSFRHWRALRAARDAAAVVGQQAEQAAAERAARIGWGWQIASVAILALVALAITAWFWR